MKSPTTVHIINHTHWDREWFLTSIYTRQWIPNLIEHIEALVADNPEFRYLFDGQTLVIEDLLEIAPAYEAKVRRLVEAGNLMVGPYYCQPDWQLTAGELLLRNLELGLSDTQKLGGESSPGWLVDTFGHLSQAPQIHRLFGLDAAYVWRGVPKLLPFFKWAGADGQTLLGIDLFGGYRNLYGVTHVPEIALKRLTQEVERLRPFYPIPQLPLFDGYDLEVSPEDPLRFFMENGRVPDDIKLQESTSTQFVQTVRQQLDEDTLPQLHGELNSGKFGATFPGTYSARTYQKVQAYDCETLLFKRCEPLAALAQRPFPAETYEAWSRTLLQNGVHDCICGVSIDPVHEKMDVLYRRVFEAGQADVAQSLSTLLADFAAGEYAVSSNPLSADVWVARDAALLRLQTVGAGVWPVAEKRPLAAPNQRLEQFEWQNDHYAATLEPETGVISLEDRRLGRLLVFAEAGDTYSDETGELLGELSPTAGVWLEQEAEGYRRLRLTGRFADVAREIEITAVVHLIFDDSPLIRWEIELDSRGTDFRVELRFETAVVDHGDEVLVAMPFDHVRRSLVDDDLLPREVAGDLADILMGQRELNEVRTFPMHDFVGFVGQRRSAAVLSKGVRSYQAFADGTLSLTLRRSVAWVTKANLDNRIGDAGPFFYVPDARCERRVQHELAFYAGKASLESERFLQLNEAYHNPPLLVQVEGKGKQTTASFPLPAVPLSSLVVREGRRIGRFYNPTTQPMPLGGAYQTVDVWGEATGKTADIGPKQIVQLVLPLETPVGDGEAKVNWKPSRWRVGADRGRPETAVLEQLGAQMTRLSEAVERLENELLTQEGAERLRTEHQIYIVRRELLEYTLTVYLSQQKLAQTSAEDTAHLFVSDPKIVAIGTALNNLRIKRRIFDYVAKVL